MSRPPVDVVVPFAGDTTELEALAERLSTLRLGPGDSLLIVANSPTANRQLPTGVPVVPAPGLRTPAFARNTGAGHGRNEWLVFLDADVSAPPDLIDRYFDPPPGPRTALLGGGLYDEAVPGNAPAAARYAYISGLMSQDNTQHTGDWGFVQTANAACRRSAFEAVGGFRQELRAGEDADLAFRLREAGWAIELRDKAAVVHTSRPTVRGLLRQKALHGAGAGWLAQRYPGSEEREPRRRRPGLVWWLLRSAATGVPRAALRRDRDIALRAVLEPLETLAYELGRSLPNERPLRLGRRRRSV